MTLLYNMHQLLINHNNYNKKALWLVLLLLVTKNLKAV